MVKTESTDLDSGWADALSEVYDTEVKTTADPSGQEEPEVPAAEEKKDEEPEVPETPESEDEEEPKEDDKEEPEDPEEPEPETPSAPDTPAPSPKDAVKEALRELNQERQEAEATRKAIKSEVLETLYPEGLDRQLRDDEGDPITSIDDLTKLINPKTNELFTEEEAGAWLLSSQRELNKTIEQIEEYVEGVAETHMTLKESSQYVEEKWGEVIKAFPEVADKVLASYNKTLVKDKKTGIVIKAPVDMADYYDIALSGYAKMSEQMERTKRADEKAAAAEQAAKEKAEQEERADVGSNGESKTPLPKAAQEWANAYKSYYEA